MYYKRLLLIAIFSLCIIGFSFDYSHSFDLVPVYNVISLEEPETALRDDANALGFNLTDAFLEGNHCGWWIFSSDDFEIRRHAGSGYFTYINKKTEWIGFEKGKEPVDEEELKDRALSLLEAVGIPKEQIYRASVHRIESQFIDDSGGEIGNPITNGFIVSVLRHINGIPVVGSDQRSCSTQKVCCIR